MQQTSTRLVTLFFSSFQAQTFNFKHFIPEECPLVPAEPVGPFACSNTSCGFFLTHDPMGTSGGTLSACDGNDTFDLHLCTHMKHSWALTLCTPTDLSRQPLVSLVVHREMMPTVWAQTLQPILLLQVWTREPSVRQQTVLWLRPHLSQTGRQSAVSFQSLNQRK